jgi:hypothetical protein
MATKTSSKNSEDSSQKVKELRDLTVEAARVQLAAMSSVVKFWSGWAQSAEKYTQALSEELAKIDEEGTKPDTALSRLGDLTREYLRDLGKLPSAAADQFSSEIDKLSKPKTARARVARVKN